MEQEKQDNQENILVIGPSWIGDMVMAQSLLMTLKERNHDCRISVMAPAWTRPLLERMPQVEKSIDAPMKHGELKLGTRRSLGKRLKSEAFTSAIILPNSFKSALVPFHASIPRRIGWRGEWRNPLLTDCRKLDKEKFPLMVQRFAALADPVSINPPSKIPKPRLHIDSANVAIALQKFGLDHTRKITVICPGAEYGESKQWPSAHYATLCNSLITQGWTVWIFGSSNDVTIGQAILSNVDSDKRMNCKNLAGKTSLAEAIDLMSTAQAIVSNDSGLMHIAAALAKPVVAIYGSTSPDFTPPLTKRVKLLSTDIECRPCFKRECPFGHQRCLTELDPARVIRAVDELASTIPTKE
ncbi:MAG: lipopolysaccharide heptosyltransferase II [Proteobacteria bacterium]|nr:lipopolysaccharide heptosyltransferase II [Pseudomonadota bacterium]